MVRKKKNIMVLESQDAIQSIEQIFREDIIRVEKMINLVEQDITEQPEDIMQIDLEEISGNEESIHDQWRKDLRKAD